MNRNFYQNARKRCMPMGTNIVTDADIILMQEEEIERYRDKIDYLEDKHREKVIRIACLEEENRKLKEQIEANREAVKQTATEISDLKTENYKLKLDNTLLKIQIYDLGEPKKPTVHTVHFGDVIVYKQDADDPYEVAFKAVQCIVHMDTESVGSVELSGARIRTK